MISEPAHKKTSRAVEGWALRPRDWTLTNRLAPVYRGPPS